jgi:hypothetical protein
MHRVRDPNLNPHLALTLIRNPNLHLNRTLWPVSASLARNTSHADDR